MWALKSELRPSTLLTHRRTVLSLEQEAIRVPAGLNLTPVTGAEWPQNLKEYKKRISKINLHTLLCVLYTILLQCIKPSKN